jgi:replicative DNA helicase Mcm
MKKRLGDVMKSLLPLPGRKRHALKEMASYLSKKELADVKYLAQLRVIGFHDDTFDTIIVPHTSWPQLTQARDDEELHTFLVRVNRKIADGAKLAVFQKFKKEALEKIGGIVAPNLVGMQPLKEAAALQLFANEPIHILLLGDPGTGKTEILRSIEKLAPHAVFGLGSGASKAGLIGVYEGKEFLPGLMVEANGGVALIDELNLLKKEDRAGLYSAMEKGFVTYDKKGKHERFETEIRVLSTANPKGDTFVGRDVKFLKTQLPFDDALLSRFHLLFLLRKPKGKELEAITRKIVRDDVRELDDGDARFVREYVQHAEKLQVAFDDKYESMIVDFIENLKSREQNFLVEIGPRTVIGIIRMAKAFARARLSRNTSADDVEAAMKLMEGALAIAKKRE